MRQAHENLLKIHSLQIQVELIDLAILEHIRNCYAKQEVYRVRIQAVRDDLSAFETVIIKNLKVSLTSFSEWTSKTSAQHSEQILVVNQIIQDLKPEDDWKRFEECHRNRFIDDDLPLVKPESLTYDGFDDPIMEPAMKGNLLRKDGFLKRSFKKCYAVLTKSNFLHFFQEPIAGKNPIIGAPELSIDLSEVNLSPMMINENDKEEISKKH